MPEKNKEPNDSWLSDLNVENIEKSANLDIKPTFKIALDETVICKIIELPKLTKFHDGNSYFTMLLEKNQVIYQYRNYLETNLRAN